MSFDAVIYEAGLLLLAAAAAYMAVVVKKLTAIVGEKNNLWILPAAGSAVLIVSLAAHLYATIALLPELGKQIQMFSDENIIFNSTKMDEVKAAVGKIKNSLLLLKAFSFTCFFVSSLLTALASWLYLKLISK